MSRKDAATVQLTLQDVSVNYLIDTNCLITPNKDYYNREYRLSNLFWDKLGFLVTEYKLGIIDKVSQEITSLSPDLQAWVSKLEPYIIETESDQDIDDKYREILNYVASSKSGYHKDAFRQWSSDTIADPWLIAAACKCKAKIITFEQRQNQSDRPWKKLKIPTVAAAFDIECISLFDFMKEINEF